MYLNGLKNSVVQVTEEGTKKGVITFWRELGKIKKGAGDTFVQLAPGKAAENLTRLQRIRETLRHFINKHFGTKLGQYKRKPELPAASQSTLREQAEQAAKEAKETPRLFVVGKDGAAAK